MDYTNRSRPLSAVLVVALLFQCVTFSARAEQPPQGHARHAEELVRLAKADEGEAESNGEGEGEVEVDPCVDDETPPVITLQGQETIFFTCDSSYSEAGILSIVDDCDGDMTDATLAMPLQVVANVLCSNSLVYQSTLAEVESGFNNLFIGNPGSYAFQYHVADDAGNLGTATRTLVIDCSESLDRRVARSLADVFTLIDGNNDSVLGFDEIETYWDWLERQGTFPNLTRTRFDRLISEYRDNSGLLTLASLGVYLDEEMEEGEGEGEEEDCWWSRVPWAFYGGLAGVVLLALGILRLAEDPPSPCMVATATYGRPNAIPVALLRHFRDTWLLTSPAGTAFVDVYYRLGDAPARYIERHPWAARAMRVVMFPIVAVVALLLLPGWLPSTLLALSASGLMVMGIWLLARRRSQHKSASNGVASRR